MHINSHHTQNKLILSTGKGAMRLQKVKKCFYKVKSMCDNSIFYRHNQGIPIRPFYHLWVSLHGQIEYRHSPSHHHAKTLQSIKKKDITSHKRHSLITTLMARRQQGLTSASWYTLVHWTCLASLPARTIGRPSTSRYSWRHEGQAACEPQRKKKQRDSRPGRGQGGGTNTQRLMFLQNEKQEWWGVQGWCGGDTTQRDQLCRRQKTNPPGC